MNLHFFGAAGTVTGSRYLLESKGDRILVDCGLFQGLKNLRLRNWAPFPVKPKSISAVILTHAHLDHSGFVPALARDGFDGPVYCSKATRELCKILLADAAHLQEQDAAYAERRGFSKHRPPLPLYDTQDVKRVLRAFSSLSFGDNHDLREGPSVRLRRAGHILGAAIVEVNWKGRRIVFSGDLGRYDDPLTVDPEPVHAADYLIVESTYGDRLHEPRDAQEAIGAVIERTIARGGTVIVPAFAVGRAQMLLYYLERLKSAGRLADTPVYLNSPMAAEASAFFLRHSDDQRLSDEERRRACAVAKYVDSVEESKALNEDTTPKVIISASGMATGGRVLHHIKKYAPDPRNTILFSGFQAAGTRGAAMVAGAQTIKIHGEYVSVRAEVQNLGMLSAHADAEGLLRWMRNFTRPPRMTFVTHGEPTAADTLRRRIQDELGWRASTPEQMDCVKLS
ncbi:MAG: MBL fold metallo-hydrolase RNA specificity domain-containing protein [Methylocystis sp.]|uniref:MBL fold metallo-hydrolase RNA specificity domain-containing protein n=1 Tax=Methylocystis sp. TaxID=1911079 RepID=UPI003DA26B8A